MKERGHGTMAKVQRKLGLHATFFSERSKALDVGVVIQVLRVLAISASDFFEEVEGPKNRIEEMPTVPEGMDSIAEYYTSGQYLKEELQDE